MKHPAYTGLYLLSRIGFEAELAQEANDFCAQAGLIGYAQPEPNQAYCVFRCYESFDRLPTELNYAQWIFARQVVPLIAELTELPTDDRLSAVFAQLPEEMQFSGILAETPDTNDGKALSGLARGLTNAARQLLKQQKRYQENHSRFPCLHLLLLSGSHILVGLSFRHQSSPFAGGIQHLKLPKDAPSRAILKLEEATLSLMSRDEYAQWMRPGMLAVDLGAAPGGWTWWLTQQGMQVIAIDNANMSDAVMKTGQVEHLRVDGFTWHPRHSVHWICCDMVEQPQRVTELMTRWLQEGWAQAALFNLKLPMKKRYTMIMDCWQQLATLSATHDLRLKHLYHDREEITVVVLPKKAK